MRLKIAYVVHDYNRHMGHSRYVAELASRLKYDHEVHVFADTFDEPQPEHLHFHRVPAVRHTTLSTVLSFLPSATIRVRGDFDVVHSQGLCGLNHNISTAHFCQSAWFASLRGEGQALTWKQKVFDSLVTPLERRALCQSRTRRVIAVSERTRKDIEYYYGRTSGISVIYHGVDSERFHPSNRDRYRSAMRRDVGVAEGDFIAVYVGDMKKGCAAAIRALAMTSGIMLWCVSASQTAPFRDLARQLNVEHRVTFFPRSKDVERYYSAADAFVFPTVYDPFGLVITEAMASGLPVITSKAAGASELIVNGENGLLTNTPWNAEQIASHLSALRDSQSLRERLAAAARRSIEPLTWDKTTKETSEIYLEMHNDKSHAREDLASSE